MNYFEFYSGDYTRDTADLTLIEHGAFLLLLADYYATETPKPNHNPTLFRIARAMTEEEQGAVIRVADRFFPVNAADGLRHNTRADAEIAKARARIDAQRTNGSKGGRPPKAKSNPINNPNETQPITQTQTQTKAHQTPLKSFKSAADAAGDFKSELWARWKAMPGSGGGAFLSKLFRDHKPEQRVLEAVEQTIDHAPADPKAFVLGKLKAEAAAGDAYDDLMRRVK